MSRDGYHLDILAESGGLADLFCERADHCPRLCEFAELVAPQPDAHQELLVEISGIGVEQLGGGSHGVFADGLACQHIGEGIRDEEDLVGVFQSGAAVVAQGVELEKGVELHELYAGPVVDFALVVHLHVALDRAVRLRVAVAVREAEELAVLAEEGEVAAPGVDAYGVDFDVLINGLLEGDDDLVVKCG